MLAAQLLNLQAAPAPSPTPQPQPGTGTMVQEYPRPSGGGGNTSFPDDNTSIDAEGIFGDLTDSVSVEVAALETNVVVDSILSETGVVIGSSDTVTVVSPLSVRVDVGKPPDDK